MDFPLQEHCALSLVLELANRATHADALLHLSAHHAPDSLHLLSQVSRVAAVLVARRTRRTGRAFDGRSTWDLGAAVGPRRGGGRARRQHVPAGERGQGRLQARRAQPPEPLRQARGGHAGDAVPAHGVAAALAGADEVVRAGTDAAAGEAGADGAGGVLRPERGEVGGQAVGGLVDAAQRAGDQRGAELPEVAVDLAARARQGVQVVEVERAHDLGGDPAGTMDSVTSFVSGQGKASRRTGSRQARPRSR